MNIYNLTKRANNFTLILPEDKKQAMTTLTDTIIKSIMQLKDNMETTLITSIKYKDDLLLTMDLQHTDLYRLYKTQTENQEVNYQKAITKLDLVLTELENYVSEQGTLSLSDKICADFNSYYCFLLDLQMHTLIKIQKQLLKMQEECLIEDKKDNIFIKIIQKANKVEKKYTEQMKEELNCMLTVVKQKIEEQKTLYFSKCKTGNFVFACC